MTVCVKDKVTILLKSGIILYSHHIQAVDITEDMKYIGTSLRLELATWRKRVQLLVLCLIDSFD